MADNYINVSVTSRQNQKVTVSTPPASAEVTATTDTGKFWAKTAEKWAISDTIVENKDYSSKYYAEQAKLNATNAGAYESAVKNTYNAFLEISDDSIMAVQNAKDEAVATIASSISDIDNVKTEAVESVTSIATTGVASVDEKINTGIANIEAKTSVGVELVEATKTNAVNTINITKNDGVIAVSNEAKKQIKNIESTGFYMRDDKLYFINSEGQEEEFKSGGINDKITNCLLEVPQRIKLELADGVLTLKAGSTVTVPNGFEADGTTQKFDYVTVESDIICSNYSSVVEACFIRYEAGKVFADWGTHHFVTRDNVDGYSGWAYNTSANVIDYYNNGVGQNIGCSLPLGVITGNGTNAKSIDNVFNGMGYIGSTVWVDKGIKCLIPNGRNEDGSLKNIEYTFPKTIQYYASTINVDGEYQWFVNEFGGTYSEYVSNLRVVKSKVDMPTPAVNTYLRVYVEDENNWYYTNNGEPYFKNNMACLASYHADANNNVTRFEAQNTFRAVDYNEFSNTPHIVETYVNGASWYRVYSDGWCEQGGFIAKPSANTSITITFLKPYANTNWGCSDMIYATSSLSGPWNIVHCPSVVTNITANSFTRSIGNGGSYRWRAYGYIA